MLKFTLDAAPTSIYYHRKRNSVCVFESAGGDTTLRIVDAETLKETRKFTIKAPFTGDCIVSPDMKIAVMLDPSGDLSLCELDTGLVFKRTVSQLTGQKDIGSISSLTFSDDMKHITFCTSNAFVALAVDDMSLVKLLPSPDAYGFVRARSIPDTPNMVVLAANGTLYLLSNELQTVKESVVEVPGACDISDIAGDGNTVALANSEFTWVTVLGVKEGVTLQSLTQGED